MMNNIMGFRPLNYAEGDAVMDRETRAAIIDYITSMTGDTSNAVIEELLNLSDRDLLMARQRVEEAARILEESVLDGRNPGFSPLIPAFPSTEQALPPLIPAFPSTEQALPPPTGIPPEGGDQMLIPPVGADTGIPMQMARGGIVSLWRR